MKVSVKVPATSANLGPGFDCLGLALGLYNEISFEETLEGIVVSGCEDKYKGPDNLALSSYFKTLELCGKEMPKGLKVDIKSDIPVSRGLGSSSAMTVAGIAAANALGNLGLSKGDMLSIGTKIEGHPDNAAPCIFGGLTAAVQGKDGPIVASYEVNPDLKLTVLIPDFEVSTAKARAILPEMIDRKDGVYTLGCLGMLLKGFETGDFDMLSYALDDRLHQPYRKTLIKGFDGIHKAAVECGALGLVISGSGSTLLCISKEEGFDEKIKKVLKDFEGDWRVLSLPVDKEGTVWNMIF